MALNKSELLKCKGEEGAKPLNEILSAIVDETNIHDSRTQNIIGDANGTHVNSPTFINGYEAVVDNEHPDPSSVTRESSDTVE